MLAFLIADQAQSSERNEQEIFSENDGKTIK